MTKLALAFKNALLVSCLSLAATGSLADELTLYIIKPPIPLQWSAPSALVASVLAAEKVDPSSTVGHIAVELSCDGDGERGAFHVFDGMTMVDVGEVWRDIDQGYGLRVLLNDYSGSLHGDGYLSQIDEYSCEEPPWYRRGRSRMTFLNIRINSATCQKLRDYYEEYKVRNMDRVYGGLNTHPLRGGEGAGCSVYGTSFLEVAGLFPTEIEGDWSRKVRFPQGLIGSPDSPSSMAQVLLRGLRWAAPDQPGIPVKVPDPALMYDWVQARIRNPAEGDEVRTHCRFSKGISVDRTDVPAPVGSPW